eukprot:2513207-Amphidinium_carterae.1
MKRCDPNAPNSAQLSSEHNAIGWEEMGSTFMIALGEPFDERLCSSQQGTNQKTQWHHAHIGSSRKRHGCTLDKTHKRKRAQPRKHEQNITMKNVQLGGDKESLQFQLFVSEIIGDTLRVSLRILIQTGQDGSAKQQPGLCDSRHEQVRPMAENQDDFAYAEFFAPETWPEKIPRTGTRITTAENRLGSLG